MRKLLETFPLTVDEVRSDYFSGAIGLTHCPGMNPVPGTPWDRNLDEDLSQIKGWGAVIVVTLLEDTEFEKLRVPNLGDVVSDLGMEWLHLPLKDRCAPSNEFETCWRMASPKLRSILEDGDKVFIHCQAGLYRSGTIVAKLLIEFGEAPANAIELVRAARRYDAIDDIELENYLSQTRRNIDRSNA